MTQLAPGAPHAVRGAGTVPPRAATVLVGSVWPWHGFTQFAAALRRRGVRVVHLTASTSTTVGRSRHRLETLVYSRVVATLPASGPPPPGVMGAVLADLGPAVVAVEAEEVVAEALRLASGATATTSKVGVGTAEDLLYDKLAVTAYAADLGLAVPETWAWAPEPLPPLPLVVKTRRGFGGIGVRVVHTVDELDRALVELAAGDPTNILVQRHLPGELLHAAGVARAGRLVQAAAFVSLPADDDPFGPCTSVRVLDEPVLLASVATLVGNLGYTGMFCLDFVRDADGRPTLIDVNARVFGSWFALQLCGLDLIGAYLYAIGLRAQAPFGHAVPGTTQPVFPTAATTLARVDLSAGLRLGARQLLQHARHLGLRWAVLAGQEALTDGLRRRRAAARAGAIPTRVAGDRGAAVAVGV